MVKYRKLKFKKLFLCVIQFTTILPKQFIPGIAVIAMGGEFSNLKNCSQFKMAKNLLEGECTFETGRLYES